MGGEAASLLPRFAGAAVLCVGDVMLDRFIYGSASRISPEAPVPVVHVRKRVLVPGGVGNVVKNLAEWKVRPLTVGVVGADASADALAGFLACGDGAAAEENLALVRDPTRPTIVKTRIIAGIQQIVRYDDEDPSPLSDATTDALLAAAEKMLPRVRSIALSDYGKGVASPRLCRELIAMAAERNIPVAVDPKGFDYAKYRGAYLVKPNRKELGDAVGGRAIDTDEQAVEAGRELLRSHGIRNILVTLSERGMLLLCGENAAPVWLPSKAREVFDVTGAGDTVLAGMAAALAVGAPLELGARLATLAAGVVVGKVGTATASEEEIRKAALMEE